MIASEEWHNLDAPLWQMVKSVCPPESIPAVIFSERFLIRASFIYSCAKELHLLGEMYVDVFTLENE